MTEIVVHSELKLLCPIDITNTAYDHLSKAITSKEDIVRIGVRGGGCSGFLYNLEIIDKSQLDSEEDISYFVKDIHIVIDIFSEQYLKGTKLDYFSSLKESGFKFSNPAVSRTCGCGSSFAV